MMGKAWKGFLLVVIISLVVSAGVVVFYDRVFPGGFGRVPHEPMPRGDIGGTTHFSGLSVTGDASIGDDLEIGAQTAISVTTGGYITPTGTYQPLKCDVTAPVSLTNIAVGTAGDVLYLTNECTQTICITDTGTTKLGGNRVLGQYDSLLLWCDGTNWLEVSYVDN